MSENTQNIQAVSTIDDMQKIASLEQQKVFAQNVIKSGLATGLKSVEQVMIAMNFADSLGLDPRIGFQSITLIQNKPTLSASLIGTLLKRAGYEILWVKDFEPDPEDPNNTKTTVKLLWRSKVTQGVLEQEFTYSWNQATIAGYTSKPNWTKMPKEMMRARCLVGAARAIAPECLHGFYESTEIADNTRGFNATVDLGEDGQPIIIQND